MDPELQVQMRPLPPPNSKRLLCLDGGGVKGISSMLILDAIIERAREIEGKPKDSDNHLAYQYFDLAGGTSTGGLAALMLFRLRLSTKKTMDNYRELAATIFNPTIGPVGIGPLKLGPFYPHQWGRLGYILGNPLLKLKAWWDPSMFAGEPLKRAVEEVVRKQLKQQKLAQDASKVTLLEGDGTSKDIKKMFMCSTLTNKGESMLFRNYALHDNASDALPVSTKAKQADFSDITIVDAARATSAAPVYLPEVSLMRTISDSRGKQVPTVFKFCDGGLLNNNPIDQVWDNRYDLDDSKAQDQTPVTTCVVSIGCGWCDPKPPPSGMFGRTKRLFSTMLSAVSFATNTEAKHRDFERNIKRINQRLPGKVGDPVNEQTAYFRFNVPTGKDEFHLDDYRQMPKLEELTHTYLRQIETRRRIDACARSLLRQPLDSTFDS